MKILQVTPLSGTTGDRIEIRIANRPDLPFSRASNVLLFDANGMSAVGFRLQFQVVSDELIHAVLPQVGSVIGQQVPPGGYNVVVHIGQHRPESITGVQLVAPSATAPAATGGAARAPRVSANPSSFAHAIRFAWPGGVSPHSLRLMPLHLAGALATPATGAAPAASTPGATTPGAAAAPSSHRRGCCCCCCCCCDDGDGGGGGRGAAHPHAPAIVPGSVVSPAPGGAVTPGTSVGLAPIGGIGAPAGTPAWATASTAASPAAMPGTPSPAGGATGAGSTATPSAAVTSAPRGPGDSPDPDDGPFTDAAAAPDPGPPEYEEYVQWRVERYWPVIGDTLQEPTHFRFIVSTQLFQYPMRPKPVELVTLSLMEEHTFPGEDSRILAAGRSLDEVAQPNGEASTPTDKEGKAFFHLEVNLLGGGMSSDPTLALRGLRLTIGVPPDPIVVAASVSAVTMALARDGVLVNADDADEDVGIAEELRNFFVRSYHRLVVTAVVEVLERREAIAAIRRDVNYAAGHYLRSIADSSPATPALIAAGLEREEARACVVGSYIGVARGSYLVAEENTVGLITGAIDAARLGINLVSYLVQWARSNPGQALVVYSALSNPVATVRGVLTHALTPELVVQIQAKLVGVAQRPQNLVGWSIQIALFVKNEAEGKGITASLGEKLWKSFEEDAGFIATDYLGHTDKALVPYRAFLGAYIAFNCWSYVALTIGVDVVLTLLTGGASVIPRLFAKAAQATRIGLRPVVIIIEKLVSLFTAIKTVFPAASRKVVSGIALVIFKIGSRVRYSYVARFVEWAGETPQRLRLAVKMFAGYAEGDDLRRVGPLAEALDGGGSPESAEKTFALLAHLADGELPDGHRLAPDGLIIGCEVPHG